MPSVPGHGREGTKAEENWLEMLSLQQAQSKHRLGISRRTFGDCEQPEGLRCLTSQSSFSQRQHAMYLPDEH